MIAKRFRQEWTSLHLGISLLCIPALLVTKTHPWVTAAAILLLLGTRLATKKQVGRWISPTLIDSFIFIYLLLAAIALWISPTPQQSAERLAILLMGILGYFAAIDWLQTAVRRQHLMGGLALGGGLIALLGFFTVTWPSQHVINLQFITRQLPHVNSSFHINHNEMAGLMVLLLPLALFLPRQLEQRHSRIILRITAVSMLLMLLLTQSRNAWFAFIVSILFYSLWGRFRTRYFLIVLLLWLLLPLGLTYLPAKQRQTIALLDSATKGDNNAEQSWISRLEIWTSARQIAQDYPVVGAGLYTFDTVSRLNSVYITVQPTFPLSHAHNLLLQTAASLGIAGMVTAVSLWLTTLGQLWRPFHNKDDELTAVIGASLVAYLCFNTFDVLAWEQKPGIFIWLLLAIAMTAVSTHKPLPPKAQRLPLILLLLLSPLLPANLANSQLDKARLTDTSTQIDDQQFANDPRRSGLTYWLWGQKEQALTQWQSDPQAVIYLMGQGQQAFVAEEWQIAISWYTAALELDSANGRIHYERAQAYEAANLHAQALAEYQQAITLLPGDNLAQQAKAWEGIGRTSVQLANWQQAAVAFSQAVTLMPNIADYQQQLHDVNQMLQEMKAQQ